MDPITWKAVGYTIGVILIGLGSAFSAHKMQKTIRAAPVWDNGEKLGLRDAVRRLVIERDVISDRLIRLEVKNERLDQLEEAMERNSERIAALERAVRAWRST